MQPFGCPHISHRNHLRRLTPTVNPHGCEHSQRSAHSRAPRSRSRIGHRPGREDGGRSVRAPARQADARSTRHETSEGSHRPAPASRGESRQHRPERGDASIAPEDRGSSSWHGRPQRTKRRPTRARAGTPADRGQTPATPCSHTSKGAATRRASRCCRRQHCTSRP